MHLISVKDIPMTERRPKMVSYISSLKRALLDPSLSSFEKDKIRTKLAKLR